MQSCWDIAKNSFHRKIGLENRVPDFGSKRHLRCLENDVFISDFDLTDVILNPGIISALDLIDNAVLSGHVHNFIMEQTYEKQGTRPRKQSAFGFYYSSDDASSSAGGNHQQEPELASDEVDPAMNTESGNTRSIATIDRTPLDFDDREYYVTHATKSITRLAKNAVTRELSRARSGPFVDMEVTEALDETIEILVTTPVPILRALIRSSLR